MDDGEVARERIALDIKYRKISRETIEKLCADETIKATFIGTSFRNKRPKREWNKDYLGRLSCAVVAESFNLDYLLYLDEVAEYVSKAKYRKIVIAGAVIVFVIVAGVVVYSFFLAP